MSLHYLLDGYNIIQKMPVLKGQTLEEARRAFVKLIEIHRPQGSLNNPVTVVFDGQTGMGGSETTAEIHVVFSSGNSADDVIKDLVDRARVKSSCIVVTDDRSLQYYVRALGAKILGVDDFLTRVAARGPGASGAARRRDDDRKSVSATWAYKITNEMSEIWLKKPKKSA